MLFNSKHSILDIVNIPGVTMNKLSMIFLIIIALMATSCGSPPENAVETSLLSMIKDNLDTLNTMKTNDEGQLRFFKNLTNKFDGIISFREGSTIKFISKKAEFNEKYIISTLENNKFQIMKDLYVTFEGRDTYYSLDNVTWLSNKTDPNTEDEGVRNDYHFTTSLIGKELVIEYSMGLMQGRKPIYIKKKIKRPVIKLAPDMVFSHIISEKVNADLTKNILFIPKNTIITGTMNVNGNLISSTTSEDKTITLSAKQDLFVYIMGQSFSLSFDRQHWNPNILSFDIKPDVVIRAISGNEIYFDIEAMANYEKDTVSMSIIQLLLRSR